MKRIIALLLTLSFAVICLCSCVSEEKSAYNYDVSLSELMNAICEKYDDIPEMKRLFTSTTDEDDDGYFDTSYAGYIYTGNYKEPEQWAMLEDYIVRLPEGKSAFEIHIFKVKDENNVEAVKEMAEGRKIQLLCSDNAVYDPEGFKAIIDNAEVLTYGRYVFLLITSGNAPAVEVIEEMIENK